MRKIQIGCILIGESITPMESPAQLASYSRKHPGPAVFGVSRFEARRRSCQNATSDKEVRMHSAKLLSLSGLAFMLPILLPLASAQQGQPIAGYKLLRTVTIPGGLAGHDVRY